MTYLRRSAIVVLSVFFLGFGSLGCGRLAADEAFSSLGDWLAINTIQLDLANSHIPSLMKYDRLFTAPSHDDGTLRTTNASGGTFSAGAAKVSLLGSSYLGPYVGDMPLAGFNREATNTGNIFAEVGSPGEAAHHHFFKKTDGKYDDIYSRALVMQHATGNRIVIVVVDMVAVSNDLYDQVYASLQGSAVISNRSQLFIAATHTHSGPGAFVTRPLWKFVSGDVYVPVVYNAIVSGIVQSVNDAVTNLGAARADIASTTGPDVVKNRRQPYYTGTAPLNKTLTVLNVQTTGGAQIAALFNFAIHGTCVSAANTLLSGDCPGNAMTRVENSLGGVALHLNGAEGDVKPHSLLSFFAPAAMDDIGTKIASSVTTVVGNMASYSTSVTLKSASQYVTLDTPEVKYGPMLGDYLRLGLTLNDSIETSAYFGGIAVCVNSAEQLMMTSIPGEAITELGNTIISNGETAMAGCGTEYSVIAGLTNGHMGYIATADQYDKGGYESAATFHGRGTASFVSTKANAMQTSVAY